MTYKRLKKWPFFKHKCTRCGKIIYRASNHTTYSKCSKCKIELQRGANNIGKYEQDQVWILPFDDWTINHKKNR